MWSANLRSPVRLKSAARAEGLGPCRKLFIKAADLHPRKSCCPSSVSNFVRIQSNSTVTAPDTSHGNPKYAPSPGQYIAPLKKRYDVICVGGGHNALVAAAYLAKANLSCLVLERRHCVGGAAVTEEIIPGFKFSRASYLAGLLRPQIIKDLELEKYGFRYLSRDPSSFTPTLMESDYKGKYLILGADAQANWESIAQFSRRDADAYVKYEEFLGKVRQILQPLLDAAPPDITQGGWREKLHTLSTIKELLSVGYKNKEVLVPFYELFTGPAEQILDRWFESDILKTTLATDAVIGALVSTKQNGSAYVLLHHVMGEAAGRKGVWAYVEGGMGAVSEAIAGAARAYGAEIAVNAAVKGIITVPITGGRAIRDGDGGRGGGTNERADGGKDGGRDMSYKAATQSSSPSPPTSPSSSPAPPPSHRVAGVVMTDGSEIYADIVISGCTPYHTFIELLGGMDRGVGDDIMTGSRGSRGGSMTGANIESRGDSMTGKEGADADTGKSENGSTMAGAGVGIGTGPLPSEFVKHIHHTDYSCGAFKINCAIDKLPNFTCYPSPADGQPGPMHKGTIHFESRMSEIEAAYRDASKGIPARRPVVELTLPSAVDPTLAPPGQHVAQLFVQFAPYDLKEGSWADPAFKQAFVNRCLGVVEEFAPGFTASIIGIDALSPLDLENIFGLHKGSISHGALSLHQLGYARPGGGYPAYNTPVGGLYLCGAGAHPGGGVMGAPGRNCALAVLRSL